MHVALDFIDCAQISLYRVELLKVSGIKLGYEASASRHDLGFHGDGMRRFGGASLRAAGDVLCWMMALVENVRPWHWAFFDVAVVGQVNCDD